MKYHQLHFGIFYILLFYEQNGSTYERLLMYLSESTRDQLRTHIKDLIQLNILYRSEGSTEYREGRSNAIFDIPIEIRNQFINSKDNIEEIQQYLKDKSEGKI